MANKKIPPCMGMDNTSEESALEVGGKVPQIYALDIMNIDVTETGRFKLREGIDLVSSTQYKYLWQSTLHNDCFAAHNGNWVKINLNDWSHDILAPNIANGKVDHLILNNKVLMSSDDGLYTFDGTQVSQLCIDTPAPPYINIYGENQGSIPKGEYAFAISWLVNGVESAISELTKFNCSGLDALTLIFPMIFDQRITHVRLYMSETNGGELRQVEDYPISTKSLELHALPNLGRSATNIHLSPMKNGNHICMWYGRLITTSTNIIYFSESLNFHLIDERYNFIAMPQRITFLKPVDGGLWVGQFDHVVFIRGSDPKSLNIERKASSKPITNSAFMVASEVVGSEISQGGSESVMWLSETGYVVGTATGQIIELHANRLSNITAQSATAVRLDKKVITLVH